MLRRLTLVFLGVLILGNCKQSSGENNGYTLGDVGNPQARPNADGVKSLTIDAQRVVELPKKLANKQLTERNAADYFVDLVDDVKLVRLFADRFQTLSPRKKILAGQLSRALLAGRDIGFDQVYKDSLEIRDLLEKVLGKVLPLDPQTEKKLSKYFLLMGIHGGIYDSFSNMKLRPEFSYSEFASVVRAAHAAGLDLGVDRDEPLEAKLLRLKRTIFDAEYQPYLNPYPKKTRDPLAHTLVNLYQNITRRSLRSFEQQFPHNSRLVNIEGKLFEEVYRAGDRRRQIAPGRYAPEIRRVVTHLQSAVASSNRSQRVILNEMIEYLRTGETSSFDAAVRIWQDSVEDIEFILGFFDRRWDPRGRKGVYEGLVGMLHKAKTSKLEALIRHMQFFENQLPWSEKSKKQWDRKPLVAAVDLLSGVGSVAPLCRMSYRIPPKRFMGESFSRKILLFSNAIEASFHALAVPLAKEFLPKERSDQIQGKLNEIWSMQVALKEVLGAELGLVSRDANQRIKHVETLLELKSELIALWLLAEPKLREMGLLTDSSLVHAGWDFAVARLVVLDSLAQEPLWPAAQARRILVRFLVEKSKVLVFESIEDKAYPTINDYAAFKEAGKELLVQCGLILSTGNGRSASAWINAYEKPGSWPQIKEIAERAKRANLRKHSAFVLPRLIEVENSETGKMEDVGISHTEDFNSRLMRIAEY